ncbi:hypothetical protein M422DRAFT_269573 [Sphaerobolus stellatus SS14]|uniref:Unplaced genomic scaffold SPHSTscaffold_216, whole genome shotgun sequence n=1 Tax=Sphaerobolus stellatus (strain SS14) TaxID=990650 RepID=A0A0C9THS5_SPHS4|nr:hypothetical protein M422DRAFT_269573 [Sphaerobolus stellatus SS14]
MAEIRPFKISVSDEVLSDLKVRLNLARFPVNIDLPPSDEWAYGTPEHRVKDLVKHWKTSFDWRKIEADINAKLPQFTTPIDAGEPHGDLDIHFVHKRSNNPHVVPLLFVHGWPGNFLEVSKILEPLINPSDAKSPSFHVVAPSLPGYVFSEASKYPGIGLNATSDIFDRLMKKLGYNHYIAQGGDWGSMVVKALATLAYGLTDSPTGLLAWIYEKLYDWSDNYPWTSDEIITWVMLYWISIAGPVGSVRYYKENKPGPSDAGSEATKVNLATSKVPIGVSVFPKELFKPPEGWAGIAQPVKYFKRHDSGGHFAAYEKPDLLVDDIRKFSEIIIKEDKLLWPQLN